MRLINTKSLELKEFFDFDITKYAILSHRWEADEITFQDYRKGRRKDAAGYDKVKKFCAKAAQEGHKWAWVDTCCIDKKSSAELSEAINSMFRWYANAAVCYAYLSDVHITGDKSADLPQVRGLRQSKWFTRGWTLQELLAPEKVVFLDCDWDAFGTKMTLAQEISTITGIRPICLQHTFLITLPFRYVSVAEKMSWASKRKTSRVEDEAYCLLGIFGINMSLLYGEGMKAFLRLQKKIIKDDVDMSIFAWDVSAIRQRDNVSVFAPSPACFSSAGDRIIRRNSWAMGTNSIQLYASFARSLYATTHRGFQVDALLVSCSDPLLGTGGPETFGKHDRLWVLYCGPARRDNTAEIRLCAVLVTQIGEYQRIWVRTRGDTGKVYFLREDAVVSGLKSLERGRIYIEV